MVHQAKIRRGSEAEKRIREDPNKEFGKGGVAPLASLPRTPDRVSEDTKTGVFRTEEGRLGGITIKGGRTFLGLSPDEVREIQGREAEKGRPIGQFGKTPKELSQAEFLKSVREDPASFGFQSAQELQEERRIREEEELRQTEDVFGFKDLKNVPQKTSAQLAQEQRDRPAGTPMTAEEKFRRGVAISAVVTGLTAGFGAGVRFIVAGTRFAVASKAVKVASVVKASSVTTPLITQVKNFGIGILGFIGAGKIIGFDLFEGKLDEQQQAINTFGQVASTLVGDVTTGVADPQLALKEIKLMEDTILQLERDIKQGTISSARARISGKVFDLNADILDQLDTLKEGRDDIRSFIIQGRFPELTPYEVNVLIRQLEEEGFLEIEEFAPLDPVFTK